MEVAVTGQRKTDTFLKRAKGTKRAAFLRQWAHAAPTRWEKEDLRLLDFFYSVTTGPSRRRTLMTPIGPLVFTGILLLLVFGSLHMDRALGLPRLFPGVLGSAIGGILLVAGLGLSGWCVVRFLRARGTPVPFNPPRELVTAGPYAWSRNPMLTGVFACLFGLGFFLHSVSMVVVWTPVFVLLSVIEIKTVEEPELERRFGASYREYKRRVPMFVPRVAGVMKNERRPV